MPVSCAAHLVRLNVAAWVAPRLGQRCVAPFHAVNLRAERRFSIQTLCVTGKRFVGFSAPQSYCHSVWTSGWSSLTLLSRG